MIWPDLILFLLGVILIALSLFPFSPMTLKLYMPRRETMLSAHRYRWALWKEM